MDEFIEKFGEIKVCANDRSPRRDRRRRLEKRALKIEGKMAPVREERSGGTRSASLNIRCSPRAFLPLTSAMAAIKSKTQLFLAALGK